MRPTIKVMGIVSALALTSAGPALSGEDLQQSSPPPHSITLPDGYRHRAEPGVDSLFGLIWREGGPRIRYEIGPYRADPSQSVDSKDILWVRRQPFRGDTLVAVRSKQNRLDIKSGAASFDATDVRTEQDVADVLLMAVTYWPDYLK